MCIGTDKPNSTKYIYIYYLGLTFSHEFQGAGGRVGVGVRSGRRLGVQRRVPIPLTPSCGVRVAHSRRRKRLSLRDGGVNA